MKLNENFHQQEFINWIGDFLPDFQIDPRKVDVSKSFQGIKSIQTIGESSLGVRVYIIETEQDPSRRKIGLATESFTLLRDYGTPNAIIVYYSENSSLWRLSLLTSTLTWDEGKIKKKLSNPKRQSYVLGSKAKVKTPYQYLISKGKVADFTDLKSRFSLEIVNKEFYKEISSAFIRLVGGQIANGKSKKTVEALLKLPFVQDHSQTSQEFAVRLIGRIIFCWFLREKRSASGHSLMPRELLSFEASSTIEDYYHKILEPIFFEVLNKPIKTRKDTFINDLFSAIPYLNGGLFSPHEDDFFNYNEGKQAINHNIVVVPDAWLKSLFEVLETFNFTIDENTSFDEELSIDPEMLGRIFENLLAEINPETGESARKNTGSYYTPRAIVDYMVNESLFIYLKNKTRILDNKIRAIISYDLEDDKDNPITDDEKNEIAQYLSTIKILDPACGSGAFPIGALQKIVYILQQIDPHGHLWFRKQIQNTPIELRKVIEKEFEEKNFDYIRKLGIIRENIYGVDIQPIATEISRLRCFLTLIVDERIDDTCPNRGIEPLPNLDFKFVTANSLVGLPKLPENQLELFDDRSKIEQLKSLRDQYFTARNEERKDVMISFSELQSEMINELVDKHSFTGVSKAELTRKLTDWKPFKHKSTDWLDIEWMFGIKDGFDLLIGNPPYLRIQGLQAVDSNMANKYKQNFLSATGAFDLYILFIEQGIKLINSSGILNYIIPHKWVNSSFGSGIRKIVADGKNPHKMISFGAHQVFNASNYTSLMWFTADPNNQFAYYEFSNNFLNNEELEISLSKLSDKDFNFINLEKLTPDPWILTNQDIGKILDKLFKQPQSVKTVFSKIFQGIATSKDSVYFLEDCVSRGQTIEGYSPELDERIEIEIELVKPLLRGEQVHRYTKIKTDNYVIFPYFVEDNLSSRSAHVMEPEYIQKKCPLGWNYFIRCEKTIKSRERNRLAKDLNWYKYIYPKNISNFGQPKIITPEISFGTNMTYDFSGEYYHNTKCYSLIKKPEITADYKYYLGILNSRVMWFFLNNTGYVLRGGYFTFKTNYLEPFPLPSSDDKSKHDQIVDLVDQIYLLEAYGSPQYVHEKERLEKLIDQIVYDLYELNSEEISFIQGSND